MSADDVTDTQNSGGDESDMPGSDSGKGFTETLADGLVSIEVTPSSDAKLTLTAYFNGELIESGDYGRNVFSSPTVRGQFLNSVENSLTSKSSVDAGAIRRELKEWFAEMSQILQEEQE